MDLLKVIEHHGYAVTGLAFLIGCCGMPVPLSIVLVTAGATAHSGGLNFFLVVLTATSAGLAADTLMYYGGRFTGWWLLAGLCQASMNPDKCIFSSANEFYKRGPKTLLIAKFVPGLATVSSPLAGSLNMRLAQFLRLDGTGVLLYVTTYTTVGYVFSKVLRQVIEWVETLGHVAGGLFLLIGLGYLVWLAVTSIRDSRYKAVERVQAKELFERLSAATHEKLMVIADVRSHGYYDPGMQRIKNSIRVEPNRLKEELVALREFMQPECEIYLYCSCAREATSVRVAKMLEQENCRTKVIQGGLKAWVKAGGPTEPIPLHEMEHLPRFE